jgi:hypothetical protein
VGVRVGVRGATRYIHTRLRAGLSYRPVSEERLSRTTRPEDMPPAGGVTQSAGAHA